MKGSWICGAASLVAAVWLAGGMVRAAAADGPSAFTGLVTLNARQLYGGLDARRVVLGPDGQVYGQHDAPPGFGTLATNQWSGGDLIRDSHRLVVADSAPPGQYTLIAGLYDPTTGERVLLAGSDDTYVELTNLTLGPRAGEP